MKILGIETSCDETAASVAEGKGEKVTILSNIIASQIGIFKKYGGVIPEVAAREHVLKILPVINEALAKAKIKRPDALAVTIGPGLVTSLMVGVETAKTLAYAWKLPLVAVNHIEGHIYANFINNPNIKFPALILTVSGGHTQLVLMKAHGKYKTIGETRDDAAGEAFDKAAQIMGVGYPGGPIIAKLAEKAKTTTPIKFTKPQTALTHGRGPGDIHLPRPMIDSPNFEFSFSGLKTALLYQIKKDPDWKNKIPEYCHEFQQATVDVLIHKTLKAAKANQTKTIMLAGGVSANIELRKQMGEAIKKQLPQTKLHIPELKYTTDNAAMIASAGYFRAKRKAYTRFDKIKTEPNLPLK
ncbi:MAG: tRNA (adenosine(37)-N6)-threonylcarbamoyltransferase complex transferase subunit TsaD [Patescibacteria group bacterium]|jgi:N6-L-threonylcarbamoyladenine synthase